MCGLRPSPRLFITLFILLLCFTQPGAGRLTIAAPLAVSGGYRSCEDATASPAILPPLLLVVEPTAGVRLSSEDIFQAWSAALAEPSRAAVAAVHLPLSPNAALHWEHRVSSDDLHHWQLLIEAPGAEFLRPHFSAFPETPAFHALAYPAGKPEQAQVVNRTRTAVSSDFWGPLIPGERLVLELISPDSIRPAVVIDQISVGMLPPSPPAKESWCYLDPTCYPEWDDRKTAIGLLYVEVKNKGIFCSGNLLMDAAQTYQPWFLTANHCVDNEAAADGAVVIWQFFTDTCDGAAPDWSQLPTSDGAAYRAGDYDVDFTLLLLDEPPPEDTAYLGWNRSGNVPDDPLTALHHPAGAYLRISFADLVSDADVFWQVRYTESSTEGGSSGCPLIDPDFKVIGTLSGGTASCAAMNETDYYTKFSSAWDLGMGDELAPGADDDDAVDDDITDDDAVADDDDDTGDNDVDAPPPLDDDDNDDEPDALRDMGTENKGGMCG